MAKTKADNLFKHSLLLMSAQQVGNLCTMGFQIAMGWALGPGEFQVLAALLAVTAMLAVPMDGVRTAVAHFSARLLQEEKPGDIRALLRQWWVYLSCLAVPVVFVTFFFTGDLASFFHVQSHFLIILTGLSVVAVLYKLPLIGALQGVQAFGKLAVTVHSWAILRLILGLVLVLAVSKTAVSGISGHLAATMISVVIGFWFLYGVLSRQPPTQQRVHGVRRYVLRSVFILAGFGVLMTADVILVQHYLPEASEYARASTIGRAAIFFAQPIASAMFPKVASPGNTTQHNWGTLKRALLYSALCTAMLVGGVYLFPHIPLLVMFKMTDPDPEMLALVRQVILAMSPLGLVHLIMNFEFAQHRFGAAIPLVVCALGFLGGVAAFHRSVWDVVLCLGICSVLALLSLLVGLLSVRRRGWGEPALA